MQRDKVDVNFQVKVKRAFTLIEVLLSITILSILFLAMIKVAGGLNRSKDLLLNIHKKSGADELLVKVLYNDMLNSDSITIENSPEKGYCRLYIHTKNTLYRNIYPYVLWYVSKKDKALVRVESYKKIALPNSKISSIDIFAKGIKIFKIYKKDRRYFIYIGREKPLFFEVYI